MTTPPPIPSYAPPPAYSSYPSASKVSAGILLLVVLLLVLARADAGALSSAMPMLYPWLQHSGLMTVQTIALLAGIPVLMGLVLQPIVGLISDLTSISYVLPIGLAVSACGIGVLAMAHDLVAVLAAAVLLGLGQALFLPMAARAVRQADGGWHGMAMGFFFAAAQAATMVAPALTVSSRILGERQVGQQAVMPLVLASVPVIAALVWVAYWLQNQSRPVAVPPPPRLYAVPYPAPAGASAMQPAAAGGALAIVVLLATAIAKILYIVALSSSFVGYMAVHLSMSLQQASWGVLVQSGALAAGALLGGIASDWVGQRVMIVGSAVATLIGMSLPHIDGAMLLPVATATFFLVGLGTAPIMTAMQDLAPKYPGLMAGLLLGLGSGVASLLWMVTIALARQIAPGEENFHVYSYLPLLGLVALLLPLVMRREAKRRTGGPPAPSVTMVVT